VVGRCFSATHDAHASIRSMAQCMAMGVAAGVNAALATKEATELRNVNFEHIRKGLLVLGSIIEMPNS